MPFDARRPRESSPRAAPTRRIAVVGSGVAGMSAAWLLSSAHDVVLYEADDRFGGHANTLDAPVGNGRTAPVDAGFIVFNEANYPNFTALLAQLDVSVERSCMSFGVSLNGGRVEYSGQTLSSVFARRASVFSKRHWAMLRDIPRFHAHARRALRDGLSDDAPIRDFLADGRYSDAFKQDFLQPFAAAIWSTPAIDVLDYPAASLLKFFSNHGLLQVLDMPFWSTVSGGSRAYVEKITAPYLAAARLKARVVRVARRGAQVAVRDAAGGEDVFDHVVIATHADDALAMLDAPSVAEREILGAFRYQPNRAVAHGDPALMPRRRRAWSSWNYLGADDSNGGRDMSVSYWMNRLQNLHGVDDVFVTLNPHIEPDASRVYGEFDYAHPIFDVAAGAAQKRLWTIEGAIDGDPTKGPAQTGGVWYCGAHFGAGFHEDGLQAGLAVAEAIGGVRRPWRVANESGRIHWPADNLKPALAAE